MSRILIVEDDATIARAVAVTLRAKGHEPVHAGGAASALTVAARIRPDLVLLDLGLPDRDGSVVIRGLRRWSRAPILVLSARHDQAGKVAALDAGADDYVTKPFGMEELLARIRAALRRVEESPVDEPVVRTLDGRLEVDLAASRVRRDGETVKLTPNEWRLLEHLARHAGRLVTRAELLREVWGSGYEKETGYLRVYLSQLRQKLEVDSAHPAHLVTESGLGYRFVL